MSKMKNWMNQKVWKSCVVEDTYLTNKDCLVTVIQAIIGIVTIGLGAYYLITTFLCWLIEKIERKDKKTEEKVE